MKKKSSLKWKIARYLLSFAIGLILLLTIFQNILLEPMYERYKRDTVRKAGNEVVEALTSGNQEDLTNTIWTVSAANDTCVRIIDTSGVDQVTGNMGCVLYRMNTREILEQYSLARDNGNEYFSSSEGIGIPGGPGGQGKPGDGGMKNITLTRIVDTNDGTAIVMVYAGLSPVNATIATLRLQIVYIAVIVFLSMILLTWIMNRRIATPLVKINEAAKELPKGVYQTDSKTNQYREAQELNETLSAAAEDIQKADRAKRDLIANVSHDLRTPLTMIKGYGEMMRDLPGEKTDENLEVIIRESERLKYLVDDLLDLSKLEEDMIELHRTDFLMSDLVARNVNKYRSYHKQDAFEIRSDCEEGLVVNADESRIEQVFNNFMSNAVNYSGSSRVIEVRCFRKDDMVRTEVQDFGEGIESDKIDDIWDRYYKIDRTHVRQYDSSGLGLNICRKILDLHQAPYGVVSKLNEGSTFWFELPAIEPESKS